MDPTWDIKTHTSLFGGKWTKSSIDSYQMVFADSERDLAPWAWFILGGAASNIAVGLKHVWHWTPPKPPPLYFKAQAFLLRQAADLLGDNMDAVLRQLIVKQTERAERWETTYLCRPKLARPNFQVPMHLSRLLKEDVEDRIKLISPMNPYFELGRSLIQCISFISDRELLNNESVIRQLVSVVTSFENQKLISICGLDRLKEFKNIRIIDFKNVMNAMGDMVVRYDEQSKTLMSFSTIIDALWEITETVEWLLLGRCREPENPKIVITKKATWMDWQTQRFYYRGMIWPKKLAKNATIMKLIIGAFDRRRWPEVIEAPEDKDRKPLKYSNIKNAIYQFNSLSANGRFLISKGSPPKIRLQPQNIF